jgi:hypothetical protein
VQVKITSFIGAAALAVAVIAVNLPASVRYVKYKPYGRE